MELTYFYCLIFLDLKNHLHRILSILLPAMVTDGKKYHDPIKTRLGRSTIQGKDLGPPKILALSPHDYRDRNPDHEPEPPYSYSSDCVNNPDPHLWHSTLKGCPGPQPLAKP